MIFDLNSLYSFCYLYSYGYLERLYSRLLVWTLLALSFFLIVKCYLHNFWYCLELQLGNLQGHSHHLESELMDYFGRFTIIYSYSWFHFRKEAHECLQEVLEADFKQVIYLVQLLSQMPMTRGYCSDQLSRYLWLISFFYPFLHFCLLWRCQVFGQAPITLISKTNSHALSSFKLTLDLRQVNEPLWLSWSAWAKHYCWLRSFW